MHRPAHDAQLSGDRSSFKPKKSFSALSRPSVASWKRRTSRRCLSREGARGADSTRQRRSGNQAQQQASHRRRRRERQARANRPSKARASMRMGACPAGVPPSAAVCVEGARWAGQAPATAVKPPQSAAWPSLGRRTAVLAGATIFRRIYVL